ncbi:uncharacterized protein LOC110861290 isoform X2 [Folsomia candida]|uniref:uncharacterized protein LOC110861290 isoform X2 n=1 Tax=Folsomia candida TaxID=158441 RepID=UPI001604DF86|nr:uncharacterized protein LOC110861290 isoform X2 [Folsomia candida]
MEGADLFELPVWTKTLLNPLILDNIFSHLDFTTLKNSVRPVCTVWADLSASHLGRLGRLRLSHIPKRMNSFHPKLANCISLRCFEGPCCSKPGNYACTLDNDPVTVNPEISKFLTKLVIKIEEIVLPKLGEGWNTFKFRNRLGILVEKWGDDEAPQFRSYPNLKTLVCIIRSPWRKGCHVGVGASTIVQGLLNSAPNLAEVKTRINFYPDFTLCKKLKILKYEFDRMRIYPDPPAVSKMLNTCSNSLVRLTLDGFQGADKTNKLAQISNYFAPNLTHLTIVYSEVNFLLSCLDVAHLPKLTHFAIKGIVCAYVDTRDVQAAAKIVHLYPSVTKFKMSVGHGARNFEHLKEMLNSFGEWNLSMGKIVMSSFMRAEHVAAVLEGMAGWRGLQNTTLHFRKGLVMFDRARNALLSCGSIRHIYVHGAKMVQEDREDLRELIAQRNLPISLISR